MTKTQSLDAVHELDEALASIAAYVAKQKSQEQLITADGARALGVGNAEWRHVGGTWAAIGAAHPWFEGSQYRAIRKEEPAEPTYHIKLLGEIYGFLQSTCPMGIADEAFRIVPETLRTQAIAPYVEPRDEIGERLRHSQEVGIAGVAL